MPHYVVLFDCYWDENYPVKHTYGEFPLCVDNDLQAIYYITKKFLHHPSLCGYHFIVDSGEAVFEIKVGA